MAGNPLVQQYIAEITTGSGNPAEAVNRLSAYWETIQEQYAIYDEIYFITRDRKILASTDKERINTVHPRDDFIKIPLETGEIYFQDAYFSMSTHRPCIAFSVPVATPNPGNQNGTNYPGVLVYRVDIGEVIQPLLESRVNLGNTGEVILINRERTTLTDLRSRPGSALKYKLKTEAAAKVIQGEEGILQAPAYTGNETLAVYRYIPSVKWGLIVRQDISEIFAPLHTQLLRYVITDLLAFTLILVLLFQLINRALKPVIEMSGAAREISQGDFSKRVTVESNDEIGILGKTFNFMAAELRQQFTLQQSRQEVIQSLVTILKMDDLLQKGLETLCTAFDFKVGAVYLSDSKRKSLVRKALFCPGRELNGREILGIGEGLEGHAVHTREVQVLTMLPEDTLYTVNWLGGNILPKSIVAVPLVFGEKTLGVLSLASLKNITPAEVKVLKTIGNVMGVTINNALSYERARELSIRMQDLNEELAQQNEELNAQSEELQCQTEELQSQSVKLQAITEELQKKNAELQKVDENKTKYLATLSHELRAPLNAVIGFSDVLLDKVVGQLNQQQEKYLHEILNSGKHLLNLINDLLDLSKIKAGQVELDIRCIDPAIPLQEALAMGGAAISRKSLEVINLVPDNTYTVSADHNKLKQIFLNLLTNAVKFTPEGGRIIISARQEQNVLYLSVADTGIGIAPQYHETIFEAFKQTKNTVSGSFGGTGLGLAITRQLLALQNGRIYVESTEGQGATFTFTLPINYESFGG
ncbi:ATP-binding protein [Desulfolucanica intricata]|uniref:ATP-binding protein n=1 Tax=Desulfolucanica intricata TaxID=1285191 RepID=UPI000836C757|nr:ATP-binding protein [Desulfolucanica intricata]